MKLLGVVPVVGPSVLAGGGFDAVVKPLVFPGENGDFMDSAIMAIRVSMAEKLSLPGPVMAQRNMTANQLEVRVRRMCFDAGMPVDCVLGGYHVL